MIICSECGNSAPSRDGFCSSCGALLEWAGETVEPNPVVAGAGPVGVTETAEGLGTPGDGARASAALGSVPASGSTATSGSTTASGERAASTGSAASSRGSAASGRLYGPTGGGPQVLPHQPAVEAERPGPEPLAVETVYTGEYCRACGVRNAEGRVFCRSCGLQLSSAPAPEPRLSWWRRLMNRLFGRRGRTRAAGERPAGFRTHDVLAQNAPAAAAAKPRRRFKLPRRLPISRLAPLLAVLAVLGVGIGPARTWVTTHVFGLAQKAQQRIHEQYVPDAPTGATASSALKGHAAGLAVDGVNNTYWATNDKKGDGTGDTLTVHFANPVDIARIGLLSGEPGADYLSEPRPRTVSIAAAGNTPTTLDFVDTANFQTFTVSLKNVTSLTITFTAVYPGQKGHDMAVTEFEFFSLQS